MKQKLIFETKSLKSGLQTGTKLCGTNKSMPILDMAKIDVLEDNVEISSTNLDGYVSLSVLTSTKNTEKCSFLVCGQDIFKAVSMISDESVCLCVDMEQGSVSVEHRNGSIKLPTSKTDEFPSRKEFDVSHTFGLASQTLAYILGTASRFVGTDELRPAMCGIHMALKNDILSYCATDAHVLVSEDINIGSDTQLDISFIIRSASVPLVLDMCRNDADAYCEYGNNTLAIRCGNAKCTITLAEGRFPNYRAVCQKPLANDKTFKLNRNELLSAINRTSMCCSHYGTIAMCFKDSLSIKAEDVDYGKNGIENMECECNGEITVGINGSLLSKLLSVCTSNEVTITASEPNIAVLVKDDEFKNRVLLLMPVMLNGNEQ